MCISICLIKKYVQRTPSMSLRMLSRISIKTKPKQTQTKPIYEMAKMNVSLTKTDDYGKNPAFCRKRNKAKSKPNKANPASSGDYTGTSFLAPGPVSGGWGLNMANHGVKKFPKGTNLPVWLPPCIPHMTILPPSGSVTTVIFFCRCRN